MFTTMWSELKYRLDAKAYCEEKRVAENAIDNISCEKLQLRKIMLFVTDRTNKLDFSKKYIGLENIATNTNEIIGENDISKIIGLASKVKKGDILFSKLRPYLNKVLIMDEDAYCSTELVVLRNKSSILSKYIMIFLSTSLILNQTKHITTGHTLPRLQLSDMKKLKVPVPNISIQEKIVNIYEDAIELKDKYLLESKTLLESIDSYIIEKLNINIPKKDNSFYSRCFISDSINVTGSRLDGFYNKTESADFEKNIIEKHSVKMSDVITSTSGVIYKRDDEADVGHAILRANNVDVKTNELDLTGIRYINDRIVLKESLKLYKDDILMCSASGSKSHAGKVAFIDSDLDCYFGGFMSVLRVKNGAHPRYVFEYMCSSIYKKLLYRRLGGTNINNVSYELMKNIPIILPSVEKQKEISEEILNLRNQAKKLKIKSEIIIKKAKEQIEEIIMGE